MKKAQRSKVEADTASLKDEMTRVASGTGSAAAAARDAARDMAKSAHEENISQQLRGVANPPARKWPTADDYPKATAHAADRLQKSIVRSTMNVGDADLEKDRKVQGSLLGLGSYEGVSGKILCQTPGCKSQISLHHNTGGDVTCPSCIAKGDPAGATAKTSALTMPTQRAQTKPRKNRKSAAP